MKQHRSLFRLLWMIGFIIWCAAVTTGCAQFLQDYSFNPIPQEVSGY